MKQLICPISDEKVNEQLTRLNAFFTVLFIITGFIFNTVLIPLLLVLYFFARAFGYSKFSLLNIISSGAAHLPQLQKKPTDKAPKQFAARMGFVMTALIALFFGFGFYTAS